ncbi:MAG: TIGR02647 family protein [Gammaproteobacteria bacterium]|nr:TIGR02647 family protein [Gammaproteobacteria bacterium]
MALTQEQLEELQLLSLFPVNTLQAGLKIHSDAAPVRIEAAQRLFVKGLITQHDGGYLTNLGLEAAQQLESLKTMLAAD